jgi:hypothetical protein
VHPSLARGLVLIKLIFFAARKALAELGKFAVAHPSLAPRVGPDQVGRLAALIQLGG